MTAKKLGLWSGVGLVIANMIGAGVLTSTGFSAMNLGPGQILLAWIVGGIGALAGARAYAAVAAAIPRSGGEYRYLSTLWHPLLGYIAGFTSLLVGFSQPVAADAQLVGYYTTTLGFDVDFRIPTAIVIILVTLLHAFDLRASRRGQNVLVAIKFALVLGFVAIGLIAGTNAWPTWSPPAPPPGVPYAAFFGSLVFIAFCYSGWNAAIYASEEFAEPRRDVPRAMMIGCAIVMAIYLLVNWVFVANLTPAHFGQWISGDHDRITLAHFVMRDLVGGVGAKLMSVFMIIVLLAAASAMTMIGPRVYAAMARDGYLPSIFAGKDNDKPPLWSVLLQGVIALSVAMTTSFIKSIQTIGTVLTLMAALTVLGVFKLQLAKTNKDKPGVPALIAAAIFVALSVWMLYFAFTSPILNTTTLFGHQFASPTVWLVFIAFVSAIYAAWVAVRHPNRHG